MIRRSRWIAFFSLLSLIFLSASARAQTDVALSIYGAFNGSTDGNGIQQSPANSAGGMVELRHISHPLIGYDVTYSYNRDNQSYFGSITNPCPTSECTITATSVSANAHELTGD